jgi:hypothetical protein
MHAQQTESINPIVMQADGVRLRRLIQGDGSHIEKHISDDSTYLRIISRTNMPVKPALATEMAVSHLHKSMQQVDGQCNAHGKRTEAV